MRTPRSTENAYRASASRWGGPSRRWQWLTELLRAAGWVTWTLLVVTAWLFWVLIRTAIGGASYALRL